MVHSAHNSQSIHNSLRMILIPKIFLIIDTNIPVKFRFWWLCKSYFRRVWNLRTSWIIRRCLLFSINILHCHILNFPILILQITKPWLKFGGRFWIIRLHQGLLLALLSAAGRMYLQFIFIELYIFLRSNCFDFPISAPKRKNSWHMITNERLTFTDFTW